MIEIRTATAEDAKFLFDLRNLSSNRLMFNDMSVLEWESHVKWLDKRLTDKNFHLYIGLKDGKEFGQFRVDTQQDVGVSLTDEFKGMGLGSELIIRATELYRTISQEKLVAIVKAENIASRKAFLKAGYVFKENFVKDGVSFYKFVF